MRSKKGNFSTLFLFAYINGEKVVMHYCVTIFLFVFLICLKEVKAGDISTIGKKTDLGKFLNTVTKKQD